MKNDREGLTKKETIRRHREVWNKIADMMEEEHRHVSKSEALLALGYHESDHPDCNCWLCEYAYHKSPGYGHVCEYCPVKWGNPENDCTKNPAFYEYRNDSIYYTDPERVVFPREKIGA